MLLLRLLAAFTLSSVVHSAPASSISTSLSPSARVAVDPTSNTPLATRAGDAHFEISQRDLAAEISCVGGLANVRKPFLLVPGTGTNAHQCYGNGYGKLLGNTTCELVGLEYDGCFVSPPGQMMRDAQANAEYVVYAVMLLSSITGEKVTVQSWSQGGLLVQWMLTFWPSTRPLVNRFISLAGDFKGTTLVTAGYDGPFQAPSVKQQAAGRAIYLQNLTRKGGLNAFVPTTSIYSSADQVVMPEPGPNDASATSFLNGPLAGNVHLQTLCPGLSVTHEAHLYLQLVFSVVRLALAHPSGFVTLEQAQTQLINQGESCTLAGAEGLTTGDIAITQNAIVTAGSAIASPAFFVAQEPPPRSYIASFPDV